MRHSWLRAFAQRVFGTSRRRRGTITRRKLADQQPILEALEIRLVPATITVTNVFDSGAGSFRQAILDASGGDTINFAPALSGRTITLTSGELLISNSVTITGLGASQLTVSGNNASRVFDVVGSGTANTALNVTISGLTITGGSANQGGAIDLENGNANTVLGISGCVFSSNQTTSNGGVIEAQGPSTAGTVNIDQTTFSGNVAGGDGGAIDSPGVTLTITNSTFVSNVSNSFGSSAGGGALSIGTGSVTVTNSTFFGNAAPVGGAITTGNSPSTEPVSMEFIDCTITGNSASIGAAAEASSPRMAMSSSRTPSWPGTPPRPADRTCQGRSPRTAIT